MRPADLSSNWFHPGTPAAEGAKAMLSILMTEELEEYFCAFMHYIQDERPDWYQHVQPPMMDEWRVDWKCSSCKEVDGEHMCGTIPDVIRSLSILAC
jgi:hypothetical protein